MRAQYDPLFLHYFDLQTAYNPAAAGQQPKLNVNVAYALNMAGFENNPHTALATADLPFSFLRRVHGAGVMLVNDAIGLFTHKRLALQYSPKFTLAKGTLGVGLQAGMLSESFDGSKVDANETNDPAFAASSVNGTALDLAVGVHYARNPWFVALSAQHINAPTVKLGERNELKINPTYYFTAGYNIRLRNPLYTIKPSVLAVSDGTDWRTDVTARLVYENDGRMLYGGVNYSPQRSVGLLVGGSFHGVILAYSYEAYTGGISLGNGSHELRIGYQRDIHLTKKGRNLHKSPRLL